MTVKMTGAEYKSFMTEDWHDGYYMDDYAIAINGEVFDAIESGLASAEEVMQATDKVAIVEGAVFDKDDAYVSTLETYFKTWRKARTTTTIVVECPKDKIDAIRSAIISAGGKIK